LSRALICFMRNVLADGFEWDASFSTGQFIHFHRFQDGSNFIWQGDSGCKLIELARSAGGELT